MIIIVDEMAMDILDLEIYFVRLLIKMNNGWNGMTKIKTCKS